MLYLYTIVGSKDASPRERTAAAKALMAADSLNVQQERMNQADEHEQRARLVAIAKHLGPERMSELASRAGRAIAIEGPGENEGDGTGQASGVPEAETGGTQGFDDTSTG